MQQPKIMASARYYRTLFIFSTCFVVLLGGVSYWRISSLIDSSDAVHHTLEVSLEVERLIDKLKDAVKGQSNYLLTHDERYLTDIHDAMLEYPVYLAKLDSLTDNNVVQKKNLAEAQRIGGLRIDYMNKMLEVSKQRMPTVEEVLAGSSITDSLDRAINKVLAEEKRLLQIREANMEVQTYIAPALIFISSVVGFVILIFSYRQLNKTVVKLEEHSKELIKKTAELEARNKELQEFAYISSHDMQEPLRKIQTFSSRLVQMEYANLSETGKYLFKRMQDTAMWMQSLVKDLLSYSTMLKEDVEFEKIDLEQILAQVLAEMKDILKDKHARVEADVRGVMNGIPFQFRQMLRNLISNSIKFAKEGKPPVIRIKSEITDGIATNRAKISDKKFCRIIVSDEGIGFEKQYNEKIFEVFKRLNSKDDYAGTGIGLSIVKKIVENHGGTILAKGEPDNGATFEIYIPLERSQSE